MADSLYTVGVGITADTAAAERMIRALQDLGRSMDQMNQHQQKLKQGMQQNAQEMQKGGGVMGYLKGQIMALGAQMLAFVGVVALVNRAVHEFGSAITSAARLQDQADLFGDLLKNTDAAKKAFQDLINYSRTGAGKIFPQDEVIEGANALARLGVTAEGILPTIQRFGVAVAIAGGKTQDWAALLEQVGKGQFMRGGTDQMKFFIQTLAQIEHVDPSKMKTMLQNMDPSKVRVEWQKFMDYLGTKTDALTSETDLYRSSVNALSNSWLALKQEFGKPIIDALTPILAEWSKRMEDGQTHARTWGEAVAESIKRANDAGKETNFDALFANLDRLTGYFRYLNDLSSKPIRFIISIVGPALGFQPITKPAPAAAPGGANVPTKEEMVPLPPPAFQQVPFTKPGGGKSGGGEDQALKDIAGDLKVINDYWESYTQNQKYASDAESRHYNNIQNLGKAISALGHPIKDVEKLMPGLSPDEQQMARWLAWEEQTKRSIAEVELKMKMGTATMAETWEATLKKMALDAKTWQTAFSEITLEIKDALVNDISGGLADILDGTKSVKQGFHDMALALLKDIERIIIKKLVELTIDQTIAAFGGVSTAGAGAGGGNVAAQTFAQEGGRIGGTGRGDHVPVLAEPGEFMIRKDSAQKIGYQNLERINKMQGGGMVRGMEMGGEVTYYGPRWVERGDANSRVGIGNSPQTMDRPWSLVPYYSVAMNPADARNWFGNIKLGDTFQFHGQTWRWDDTPKGRGIFDIYTYNKGDLAKGGGKVPYWAIGAKPGGRDPFGGKPTGGRPKLPGDSLAKRLGFPGRREAGMNFGDWAARRGMDLGDMARGDRPGFTDFTGGVPGGRDPGGHGWSTFDQDTGRVTVGWTGGTSDWHEATLPGHEGQMVRETPTGDQYAPMPTGGIPVSGAPDIGPGGRWQGGDTRGGGGFGVIGGVGLPGLGRGSAGNIMFGSYDYLGQMSLRRLRQGRDPSLGITGKAGQVGAGFGSLLRGRMAGTFAGAPVLPQSRWGGVGRPTADFHAGFAVPVSGGRSARGGFERGQGRLSSAITSRPDRKVFHAGGIVDHWSAMASGGTVKAGEGVFTPQQMASLAPAHHSSNVQIGININDNRTTTQADQKGTGLDAKDAADIGRMVTQMVDARIARQKRSGGSLYQPRSG